MLQVDQRGFVRKTIGAEWKLVGIFFLLTPLAGVKGMLSNGVNDG